LRVADISFGKGSLTVVIALLAMMVLPDYPSTTKWLSTRERLIAENRLTTDFGLLEEHITNETRAFYGLKLAVTDLKIWFLGYGKLLWAQRLNNQLIQR
jgi:hypothetical protein